jgi:erythromycin esterase
LGSSQIFGELFTFFPSQTTTHPFLQNIRVNLDPIVIPMTTEISGITDWKQITHTFQVPENAFDVFIHFRLLGKGKVWFDNLEISVNGKAIIDKAPKSNLTKKQLSYLKQNTFALNPDLTSENFADLQNFKIADETRIIGLGEGTHGTSEYFEMKTRLIKYLVQNKGYTLIGFEAFLLECEAINKYILTGEGDPKQALKGLMFWCWNTKEVLELIEWLKTYNQTAKNKVRFVGIDGQFSLSALPTLKKIAQEIDGNFLKEISPYYATYEAFTREFKFKPYAPPYKDSIDLAIVETKKLNEILAEKETYLLQKADREKVFRLLESVKILYQQMMCTKDFSNSRDVYYAENTGWFIDKKYPNEKIILWVHNWHIARNEENRKSMGFYLSEKYGKQYIPIGFASLEGTYTARGDKGIKQDNPAFRAENNSIENYLSQLNVPVLLFDLRPVRTETKKFNYLRNSVFIREIGSDVEKGNQFRFLDVPKIFDFLIYFDKTKGSELLPRK